MGTTYKAANAASSQLPKPAGIVLVAVIFAGIIVAAHWPVLRCQAVLFDDPDYVGENLLVQNPSWNSAARFFTEILTPSTVGGYYQPLSMISLMIDYSLGGRLDDLRVFHVTSLGLHVLNALLIAVIVLRLFRSGGAAIGAALLFGLHPTAVESVAWVAERKTVLATLFAFAAIYAYLRFAVSVPKASAARSRQSAWYCLSLALFILALLAKPTTTPLPLMMLLLDMWPLNRFGRRAVLEKIPFLALAVLSAVVTVISQSRTGWVTSPTDYPRWAIPLFICHNVVFYVEKFFWPANLCSFYPYPNPFGLSQPAVLIGLVGTIALVSILIISLKWTRAWAVGFAIFFVAAFPTMGVVGFTQVIAADRFLYLPMLGLLLPLTWAASRLSTAARGMRIGVAAVLILALTGEAVATRTYLEKWQTSEGLFRFMAQRAPQSAVVQRGLGIVLKWQGRTEEALVCFRRAVELGNDSGAHNNIAVLLANKGDMDGAEHHCREAIKAAPNWATPYNNLGNVLAQKHMIAEAGDAYATAVRLRPEFAGAQGNLGTIHAERGEYEKAIECYRRALAIRPGLANVQNNWGDALLKLKRPLDAEEHFRSALRLDPALVAARVGLADALRLGGQQEEAEEQYRSALEREPRNADAISGMAALVTKAPATTTQRSFPTTSRSVEP